MFRQALTKVSPVARINPVRFCCNQSKKGNDPLCAHHKELVPPFQEVCKLKSFELKSDCTTFHMKTDGYDCCCPPCTEPCPKPCPPPASPCPPKPKGPCPPENPCDKYKK